MDPLETDKLYRSLTPDDGNNNGLRKVVLQRVKTVNNIQKNTFIGDRHYRNSSIVTVNKSSKM
jgi:hypothetical protein